MDKSFQIKIILLPTILAFLTVFCISLVEGHWEQEGIGTTGKIALFVLIYFAVYFFTIIVVVPIHIYLSNKIKNRLISFIAFNCVGLLIVGSIDLWFLTDIEFKSLYMISPLFSILSLFLKSEQNN